MDRYSSRKVMLIGLGMIFGIIVLGVAGYMLIEDDTLLDALYMTIITISTVGFGEIHKLSQGGKIFTMILIITSFTTYAYALTTISTHFFEGQLKLLLSGNKNRNLRKMQNHIVICGYGRNGQQVAKELNVYNNKYVIIDQKKENVESYLKPEDGFIEGDATLDEVLLKANIKTAKGLISTLPIDADNLYVVLTARALNPNLEIISRATSESSETKLRMAGVDSVVMPERVGGAHMANLIVRPDILEFLDHVSLHGDDPTTLEEIVCTEMAENLKLKTILEIGIRKETGANIIGIKTPDGRYILNPNPETKVIPETKLFVLGTPEQIRKVKDVLQSAP